MTGPETQLADPNSTQKTAAERGDRGPGLHAGARPRVLIADPVSQAGIDRLATECEVLVGVGQAADQLKGQLASCAVLIVRSETKVTESLMLASPALQLVGRAGAGVDNIDVEAATRLGILVVNAPSGNTVAAAEHTIAMMLALARNIGAASISMREGKWDRKSLLGTELRGKVLGVIGLGRIGLEVARTAKQGLGMEVIAFDPVVGAERAEQAGVRLVNLDRLLRGSDVVTVHVPLTDNTRRLIGRRELESMKPTARIINVARGGIVDEDALADALTSGRLAGAALDVFVNEPLPSDHVLRSLPNVLLTPHLGASTEEAQVNVAVDLADQVLGYLKGEMPPFAVNLPSVLPSELVRLQPYVSLGTTLGSLGGQLSGDGLSRVTCTFAGDLAQMETSYVTGEVLRSIFSGFTEERINWVNAKLMATRHGVTVEERNIAGESGHPALMVELQGANGASRLSVGGEVVGGEPRVTSIYGFPIDVKAEGRFLVVTHQDQPGVLAAVSSLLANRDVNIGSVGLGRDQPRGRAVMVMEVDEDVPGELMTAIRECLGVSSTALVKL